MKHLTISLVADGACGKRSSIECVHFDAGARNHGDAKPTLNVNSDKFRCFNHRDGLDSAVHLPNFRLVVVWHTAVSQASPFSMMHAIYSVRLAIFIHSIM